MDASVVVAGLVCGALIVASVGGLVYLTRKQERERREVLRDWAARNGWQYVAAPETQWPQRLPGRNGRGVRFALSGAVGGRPVSVAEYTYTTSAPSSDGSSTTSQTHHLVVLVVRVRGSWPPMAVHRRGAASRFGRTLFGDRATALGYEPFDAAFRISADVPDAVRAVFGRDLVAEQLAGWLPEWSLSGDELMVAERGRLTEPDGIPARFGPLVRVAELIDGSR